MTFHRGDPWHTKHTRRQQNIMSTLQRPSMQPPSTMRRAITAAHENAVKAHEHSTHAHRHSTEAHEQSVSHT